MSGTTKPKACRHDYENAIPVGRIDHICPICKKLLNPLEWFFMNSFDFIDVTPGEKSVSKKLRKKA